MKIQHSIYVIAMVTLLLAQLPKAQAVSADVVYGKDNRTDIIRVADPRWRSIGSSTGALIRNNKLSPRSGQVFALKIGNFGRDYQLCESEPFRDQGLAAFCSGFFVGGDKFVTAGHCIRNQKDCDETSIVFGFAINEEGQTPERIPQGNVYRCNRVIHSQTSQTDGVDFAVVELERTVDGVEPVQLRTEGKPSINDELIVIGHPVGLPTKLAAEGMVRTVNPGFIVASLDTYGGNSGSAVFNAASGAVEGILVRGETDFVYKGNCRVSNVCTQDGCRGEDVTRIEHVLPFLK